MFLRFVGHINPSPTHLFTKIFTNLIKNILQLFIHYIVFIKNIRKTLTYFILLSYLDILEGNVADLWCTELPL